MKSTLCVCVCVCQTAKLVWPFLLTKGTLSILLAWAELRPLQPGWEFGLLGRGKSTLLFRKHCETGHITRKIRATLQNRMQQGTRFLSYVVFIVVWSQNRYQKWNLINHPALLWKHLHSLCFSHILEPTHHTLCLASFSCPCCTCLLHRQRMKEDGDEMLLGRKMRLARMTDESENWVVGVNRNSFIYHSTD